MKLREDPAWRERRREQTRRRYENAELRERKNAAGKAYYERIRLNPEHKERRAVSHRQRTTGFTPELVAELRQSQQGGCAICKRKLAPPGQGADTEHADHCHATKAPRGLLCMICNQVLGAYEKHQRPAGLRIAPYEQYLLHPPASWPRRQEAA